MTGSSEGHAPPWNDAVGSPGVRDRSLLSWDLGRRLGVAGIGVPVTLLCLYFGGWALGVLVASVAAITVREFYGLADAGGARAYTWLGVAGTVTTILTATALGTPARAGVWISLLLLALLLVTLGASVWTRGPEGKPLEAVSTTLTGVVYVGLTLAFLPLLRRLPETGAVTGADVGFRAAAFALIPIAATWIGDSTAFFVGKRFGRSPLAPSVSPNKTVIGSLAGLVGSVAATVVVAWWAFGSQPTPTLPMGTAAVVGLLIGLTGQVGDLAESLLKRQVGLKDSGSILPGHGGFLDRLDALLFALPAMWLLLVFLGIA